MLRNLKVPTISVLIGPAVTRVRHYFLLVNFGTNLYSRYNGVCRPKYFLTLTDNVNCLENFEIYVLKKYVFFQSST